MSQTGPAAKAQKDAAEQLVGTTISDRYKVESMLGSGGMGAVYLVQHVHMRKRYALKMLHAEMSKNPEVVARFEREAMAAANVEHPNVAVASDFGRAESGAFFLVLEYLEGRTLHRELDAGPLPVARAVHIARQVAGALERAHELKIVHRELKTRRETQQVVPAAGLFVPAARECWRWFLWRSPGQSAQREEAADWVLSLTRWQDLPRSSRRAISTARS